MHIYRSDRLYVYQRKHSWGGEGARWCITTFFTGFCEKETESGRDYFYGEAYTELHHSGGAGGLPRRRSDPRTANWTAIHFGAPGAFEVLFDARPGRSRHRVLPALGQSAQPRPRCRRRPGALSDETDTTGQFYSSTAFFSCPTIMCFTAGIFSALHHMWKAWCKQGKKKCWFMVCCRERPAWWGALVKVDIPFKYSAQVGRTTERKEKRLHIWLSGRTTRQSCQSCLDSSRHFPSFVQISTPTLFTHRDFPFLFSITTLKKNATA